MGAGEKGNEIVQGTLGKEKKRRKHYMAEALAFSHLPSFPVRHQFFNFLFFSLFSPFSRHFSTEGALPRERLPRFARLLRFIVRNFPCLQLLV